MAQSTDRTNDQDADENRGKQGAADAAGTRPGTEALGKDGRLLALIDNALRIQAPLANKYVDSIRRKHPGWTDEDIMRRIEKQFITSMTATGAGIGGAAALPGVGTAVAVALTTGEGAAFAEACAFLVLATARVRGVDMGDKWRRQTITLAILGGERGEELVAKALGKQGFQWTAVLNGVAPDFVLNSVNTHVKKWVRRKIAQKLGSVWAARLIPFGLGAVVGGLGNFAIARGMVHAQRQVFVHAPGLRGPDDDDAPEVIEG